MLKTIALAGATAALVLGSIAVAQTASTGDTNANAAAPATSDNGATANNANQNGNDAAAATNNNTANAGERG